MIFTAWDVWGIIRHHWWYNERFITGWRIGDMPIEELVFFIVVPICGLLTLEGVGTVLQWLRRHRSPQRRRSPQGRHHSPQGETRDA